jgi:hypothetical protein
MLRKRYEVVNEPEDVVSADEHGPDWDVPYWIVYVVLGASAGYATAYSFADGS